MISRTVVCFAILHGLVAAGCATGDDPFLRADASASGGSRPPGVPPVAIDASPMADGRSRPATIDAAVPAPDGASSCTTRTVQLLTNGDFDQGHVGWAESTTATPVTPIIRDALPPGVSPDSGAYLAWLGGDDDSNVQAGTDTLSQDIAVPPGTTALQISGVRWVVTDQPAGEYDLLSVQLRRATDNGLEERLGDPAVSCSSTCTWANEDETTDFARFTLTPRGDYAGRTIRVVFESEVDDSFNTNFYVDSLEATATVCD